MSGTFGSLWRRTSSLRRTTIEASPFLSRPAEPRFAGLLGYMENSVEYSCTVTREGQEPFYTSISAASAEAAVEKLIEEHFKVSEEDAHWSKEQLTYEVSIFPHISFGPEEEPELFEFEAPKSRWDL